MTRTEVAADGFLKVLKALPKAQRDAVIVRIASEKEFTRDILRSGNYCRPA